MSAFMFICTGFNAFLLSHGSWLGKLRHLCAGIKYIIHSVRKIRFYRKGKSIDIVICAEHHHVLVAAVCTELCDICIIAEMCGKRIVKRCCIALALASADILCGGKHKLIVIVARKFGSIDAHV